jgi:hypothetical protein
LNLRAVFLTAHERFEFEFCIFLSALLASHILLRGASFFDGDFFKYSLTKISDKGPTALGSSIINLKSLTNLSLNFRYFFKEYFNQFQTHLRAVFLASPEALYFEFCIIYPLISYLIFYATEPPFFDSDFIKNSDTKVSDQGLTALVSSLKAQKRLTNLSLVFRYLFKEMHLRVVFLAA